MLLGETTPPDNFFWVVYFYTYKLIEKLFKKVVNYILNLYPFSKKTLHGHGYLAIHA